MKKIISVIKWLLLAWGTISLLGVLALSGFIMYQMQFGNREETNSVKNEDVRFVLNWCNLGDDRIEKVIHSYRSPRSFTGDHLDAFAIKISHVDPTELTPSPNDFRGSWYRGDQLPEILSKAVDFVGGYSDWEQISWFPKEDEIRSDKMFVYLSSVYFHGTYPSAVEIIFVRPLDNMVFYLGAKT